MPFFQVSSGERRGVIVLCVVLLIAVVVVWAVSKNRVTSVSESVADRQDRGTIVYAQPEREVETFVFDPNTADSTTLLRLGLSPFMVRSMYRYRGMGGVYSEPSDFKRVPGLTNEMWERLSPYIRIDHRFQRVRPEPYVSRSRTIDEKVALPSSRMSGDTARHTRKLREGETVELNGSDTAELKKIPGIGSYYARQIVRHRQQLGGFVSLSQVREVDGVPDDIERYLTLGNVEIRKIDINKASKNELLRHPYINVYQATSIIDYRRNRGSFKGVDDLRRLMDFDEDDVQRLAPYLDFSGFHP